MWKHCRDRNKARGYRLRSVRFSHEAGDAVKFYKTTRATGLDFHTDSLDYGGALATGDVLQHPSSTQIDPFDETTFMTLSVTPSDALGNARFPYRLFVVQPVGEIARPIRRGRYTPHTWRAVLALKVTQELHPYSALGPNGADVFAFFKRVCELTPDEIVKLGEAYQEPTVLFKGALEGATFDSGASLGGVCARRWVEQEVAKIAPPELPKDVVEDAGKAAAEAVQAVYWRGFLEDFHMSWLVASWLEVFGEEP